jgi:hypothetical protein
MLLCSERQLLKEESCYCASEMLLVKRAVTVQVCVTGEELLQCKGVVTGEESCYCVRKLLLVKRAVTV